MDLYQYQKEIPLIPAAMDYYVISGKASILEIYIS
jgi:mannose-6-phosphate isomerase